MLARGEINLIDHGNDSDLADEAGLGRNGPTRNDEDKPARVLSETLLGSATWQQLRMLRGQRITALEVPAADRRQHCFESSSLPAGELLLQVRTRGGPITVDAIEIDP